MTKTIFIAVTWILLGIFVSRIVEMAVFQVSAFFASVNIVLYMPMVARIQLQT